MVFISANDLSIHSKNVFTSLALSLNNSNLHTFNYSQYCIFSCMKRNCPKTKCNSDQVIKKGFYFRSGDSRKIQRFQCKTCLTKFSSATGTLEYRQKKRRINHNILQLFCMKNTQTSIARYLKINVKTVARRFDYWALKAKNENIKMRKDLITQPVRNIQFDDLITKEKTKLKPLTVTVVVDTDSRMILQANVSQIPAFGHLAHKSRLKYGNRTSNHMDGLRKTFKNLQGIVHPESFIKSDEHKNYEGIIKRYFPRANYQQFKSIRGSIIGQGELKKTKHDPIFVINHTMAMLRDGISTLVRKTWAVTQDSNRFQGHLEIYMYYFNKFYLKNKSPHKGSGL